MIYEKAYKPNNDRRTMQSGSQRLRRKEEKEKPEYQPYKHLIFDLVTAGVEPTAEDMKTALS